MWPAVLEKSQPPSPLNGTVYRVKLVLFRIYPHKTFRKIKLTMQYQNLLVQSADWKPPLTQIEIYFVGINIPELFFQKHLFCVLFISKRYISIVFTLQIVSLFIIFALTEIKLLQLNTFKLISSSTENNSILILVKGVNKIMAITHS